MEMNINKESSIGGKEDYYESFNPFERLLFNRFADSVAAELGLPDKKATNYLDLMTMINFMTRSRPSEKVNEQGRR
tara:strand:- start:612 stop:839 length:228 start_codon:yes stop_codon:yes gene_type:complete